MTTTYPASKQSFTDPAGTQTLSSPDHASAHVTINDTLEAVQDALGYGAGTNIQKDFTAGDFPVRIKGGTIQDTINHGTINNAIMGTPAVTGGTVNSGVFGTPTLTLGSDTALDTFYRSSGGTVTRLPACSFLVYQSTDTTNLGNGTPKQIAFDSETYDVGSNWNTTTKQFIAPVAGYYNFYFQAYIYNGVTDTNYAEAQIRHNGTIIAKGRTHASGTNDVTPHAEKRYLVPSGGTIDFYIDHTMGASTLSAFADNTHTFASGYLDSAS